MKNDTSTILKELAEEIAALAKPGPDRMSPDEKMDEALRIADIVDQLAAKASDYQARLVSECIDLTGYGSLAEAADHAECALCDAQEKFTTDIRQSVEKDRSYSIAAE